MIKDFDYFKDNYCKHQSGYLRFGDDEDPVAGCSYKNEIAAKSWNDWQPCKEENCPFMKRLLSRYMDHYSQGRHDEQAIMSGDLVQFFSPD